MITGPVKFDFYTGPIRRQAMAFWCVMIPRKLFDEIGYLDETFSPGMGEDGDFCIRAQLAGHPLVQVPNDDTHLFGTAEQLGSTFPIFHKGSGTFGWSDHGGIIERNKKILDERYGTVAKKYSIVIPTYNHCDDLLKPCIDSIVKYTDMTNVEVIIVANGCTDNTREYVDSLPEDTFRIIWSDQPLGYTKATNLGIKIAQGEYVVLLNNDTLILESPQNFWLQLLEQPFVEKKTTGLTGPLQLFDRYANSNVLIFFCVMIKREVFEKIGLLDEIFTPGGGEDIDFTVRANQAGYDAVCVTESVFNGVTNVGNFPIWHKDNRTFGEIPEYTNYIVKRNGLINAKRYNKHIKLNLGSAGTDYPEYLSVDLYDKRAHILMDITKLDFDDESVEEILASHIFEHLNPYHVQGILDKWFRVLKPGGKLIMEMPNIEELCRRFTTTNDRLKRYGILNAIFGSVNTTDVGGPDEITSPHLFGWWPESVHEFLSGAGFINIEFMEEKIPHPESNFRVEAVKPYRETVTLNHQQLKAFEPHVYKEIFEIDVYQVTPSDVRNRVVVDVGANVGLFALRAIEYGANHVYAFEAQQTVFQAGLVPLVSQYKQITPIHRAVHSADNQTVYLPNHHVGSTVSTYGDPVQTISLPTLVQQYQIVGYNNVLKLDCEGSEFDILLPCPRDVLRQFAVIFIEIHGNCNLNPNYRDINTVRNHLMSCGYQCVHHQRQFGTDPQTGQPVPMDVVTEKWIRL